MTSKVFEIDNSFQVQGAQQNTFSNVSITGGIASNATNGYGYISNTTNGCIGSITSPPYTVSIPNYTYTWPDYSGYEEMKKEMKDIKKMLSLILEGDENPEFLEKYKNLKKAYEEYVFFRDMILSQEEKKISKI